MSEKQSARAILAVKLKELRQRSGLTIYEVGEKIGKSGKTVSAWETGRGQPDAEAFMQLYYLYNVDSMSEFFDLTEKGTSEDEHELLLLYRQLNQAGKDIVKSVAKANVASGQYAIEP